MHAQYTHTLYSQMVIIVMLWLVSISAAVPRWRKSIIDSGMGNLLETLALGNKETEAGLTACSGGGCIF